MSAVEPRQMYGIETGQGLVATVDICLVSTADICPASAADICPASAADICPVSTADVCPVSTADLCPVSTQTSAASEAAWRPWRGQRQKLTKTLRFVCLSSQPPIPFERGEGQCHQVSISYSNFLHPSSAQSLPVASIGLSKICQTLSASTVWKISGIYLSLIHI